MSGSWEQGEFQGKEGTRRLLAEKPSSGENTGSQGVAETKAGASTGEKTGSAGETGEGSTGTTGDPATESKKVNSKESGGSTETGNEQQQGGTGSTEASSEKEGKKETPPTPPPPPPKPKFTYQLPTLPLAQRLQSRTELHLIKIFDQSPTTWYKDKPYHKGNFESLWNELKPFPLANLASLGKKDGGISVTPEEIYNLKWNRRSAYHVKYSGQLEVSDLAANGIGRYQNADCFYEGEIANGLPDGYGRVIVAKNYSYVGPISKGLPNGLGEITYAEEYLQGLGTEQKAKYTGVWTNGRFRRVDSGKFINLDITSLCENMAVYFREQD